LAEIGKLVGDVGRDQSATVRQGQRINIDEGDRVKPGLVDKMPEDDLADTADPNQHTP